MMITNYLRRLAFRLQPKVIFLPKKLIENYNFYFEKHFEELFFTTEDEGFINALYFKVNEPRGVILYFHGNADNLIRWGKIASQFTLYNYNVLVLDYRGYGKSKGKISEKAMYNDAIFCYDWLKKQFKEEEIIVYGRSLGGTFAIKVASENAPKMLILECTFYNIQNMANRLLPKFITKKISKIVPFQFQSNIYIENVRCSVLQFHGTNDWIVPYYSGVRLFEKITHPKKKFITIYGGSHNNLAKYELYTKTLDEVFQ